MFKFKAGQQFRIVINGVSIHTTAKTLRLGIGDFRDSNEAGRQALAALEHTRSGTGAADQAACGIGGVWAGMMVQLDMAAF